MRRVRTVAALIGAATAVSPLLASSQEKTIDLGKREFDSKCAVCHGSKGKGDGPYAGMTQTRVADLTALAMKNNGVFPFARVYETIDGRQQVKAHGTREMPIWGLDYRAEAYEFYGPMPYSPEPFVRGRILALTEYVYRLQAK
jgi:mono/diheme cytochrome c family protein